MDTSRKVSRVNFAAPPDRWQAVAEAMKARRDELGITQTEALVRSDGRVGGSTWSHLETAHKTSYDRSKLRAVCRALGWSIDSIERIVAGQDPVELSEESREREIEQRLFRMEEQLRELLLRFQRIEESRHINGAGRPADP